MNEDMPAPEPENPQVRQAGERTMLAWIRTGLALMGFGFVVSKFGLFLQEIAAVSQTRVYQSTGFSFWLGAVLILLGIAVNVLAAIQHARFLGRLNRREAYVPPKPALELYLAGGLALVGLVILGYLTAVTR